MNLCCPDLSKSCAACCGLYNVEDATRAGLQAKLESRTLMFRATDRTPDAVESYRARVRSLDPVLPVDEAIHVCEFAGFLDPFRRVVGCQLHPSAPGNNGLDLRGLCYYGSMACKAFYCPAWSAIPTWQRDVVINLIRDWHLYGLVVTDVDFVRSLFGLLNKSLGEDLKPGLLIFGLAADILGEMFSWKTSWPFASHSKLRQNRYHFKGILNADEADSHALMERLLECLRFTYGLKEDGKDSERYVRDTVDRFVLAYGSEEALDGVS